MSERPQKIFGAMPIRDECGECDQRPVAVAAFPEGESNMVIGWACDDHLRDLALFVHDNGVDTERHIFEVTRTCLADQEGRPCGAAADFLVIKVGGTQVMSICRRHMVDWSPETETQGRPGWW